MPISKEGLAYSSEQSKRPVIPVPVSLEPLDFSKEEHLLQFIRPNRWISLDINGKRLFRFNWVVSLLASLILWAFVLSVLLSDDTLTRFGWWQSWITQNFTWFYIGTQDIWAIFLIYLFFSRFGHLKLGREEDKPEFDGLSWFAMLFACGIGVGLYYWGVSEPMSYYRASSSNRLFKPGFDNDDQRAQQAIFVTLFHWGIHGWVVYIVIALLLGFVSYRWNMPMTVRSAFFPLLGNTIYGPLGDCIDALSMACTTFGVCTSLGFGALSINAGLHRLNSSIPNDDINWQLGIIWVITIIATMSVLSGLNVGIKYLSQLTFGIGVFLLLLVLFMDNTWFLLNSFVQSIGHYIQYCIQVGFETDTWEQLNLEFSNTSNQYWGSGPEKLYNPVVEATGQDFANPVLLFGSHPAQWMDWWTIFYWGWWISWSPFVGMFIAKISRGRTIREVIAGAMFVPIVFTFFWLILFGSLGIKMERTVELALNVAPNVTEGTINCTALGYADGQPISTQAIALADIGYYSIACRNHGDRIFDVLSPYGSQITPFLHFLVVIGVLFYFVTSSDSGSFIDDTLSAGGMDHPPPAQKVYWCFVEGACASVLLSAGGQESLNALQAISICAGFPYTLAICFMCTALYRACLHDTHDEELLSSTNFLTGLFDWTENKRPAEVIEYLPTLPQRVGYFLKSIFVPMVQLRPVLRILEHDSKWIEIHTIGLTATFVCWIAFMFSEIGLKNGSYIGWTFYLLFVFHLTVLRAQVRQRFHIYGWMLSDFFAALVMYPLVVSQLALEVGVQGEAPPKSEAEIEISFLQYSET